MNALSLISNVISIFTIGSWSEIPVTDKYGQVLTLHLGAGGLLFFVLAQIIVNALFIKQGLMAIQTFEPIAIDIDLE